MSEPEKLLACVYLEPWLGPHPICAEPDPETREQMAERLRLARERDLFTDLKTEA